MIQSAFSVQRHHGDTHRTRIGVVSSPEFGNHAMISVNANGVDINVHMNVGDLAALCATIGNVLAQLEAHEAAKAQHAFELEAA